MLRFLLKILNSIIKLFSPEPAKGSDKTAVISLHKIGDSIFTIPALKILINEYNDLAVFCYPESEEIYKLIFPGLRTFVIRKDQIIKKRIVKHFVRKQLNQYNPNRIFDFTGTVLSASLVAGSRAKVFGISEYPYDNIYTTWITKRKYPHLIDVFFDALSTAIDIEKLKDIKEFPVSSQNGNMILIHPFAGWAAKEWGINHFTELFTALKNAGYCCYIISEEERIEEIIGSDVKDKLIPTRTLSDLIRNIKNCSVFIGNDSGPLYIANLLGKHTFTIYGPTNPEFSLPYGASHSFVQKVIKCSPGKNEQYCFTDAGRNGCPSFKCMKQLSVTEVSSRIIDFLKINKILPNA